MANPTIKFKRSSVQGKTPTTGQLPLGELAINTYDGKVFLKKDDGTESVIEVGAGTASTNQVLYKNSSNITAGSNSFVFDGTNVGIGTINPSQLLDVNGDAKFRGGIYDNNDSLGSSGQVLSSTGSGVQWTAQSGGGAEIDITACLFT